MSQESPPKETLQEINPSNIFEKMEENKLQTEVQENQENQESQNYLNIYQSFPLNPLEQILINKIIPYGYKLETEENLLKTDDKKKKGYLHRKHKRNSATSILENIVDNENNIDINNSNISNNNNIEKIQKPRRRKKSSSSHNTENKENNNNKSIVMRKMTREHKPKIIEDLGYIDKDVIKGKSNPLFRAVNKICEKGMIKMRKIQYYSFFYNNLTKPGELSLPKIEKNIREYKYQSTYEFIMDLRKLWNNFLKMYETQNEIKEKVCEMARKSEQLYCELESINIEKVELEDLNKKVDNLEKKLREIKGNGMTLGAGFNLKKNNMSERSLSFNEKTVIKNNIKLLTIEQKKGIAGILRDTIDTENKKILEFDIDKLNNKKLKQLDEYVKECIKKNNENKKIDMNVEKLKQDLIDTNQRNENNIENDIDKDSISDSDDSSISDSY
jgi:hypothetical protein